MMLALVAQFIGAPGMHPSQGTGSPRVDTTRLGVSAGLMTPSPGRIVWVRHRAAR